MPSLIQRYEYDIFISYRHNDNRSGWVTEFVNALREELAATIKEPLTIYFDQNPHDGLLETHNVDKSLEGKLKCFIFIPIISQTYCDPKSFAWQHEFVEFNKLAKEDQLGRDIKLSNGNVASRILPIRIHDLDAEDKSLLESELSGVLRAIEFIFKSSGVNRPLTLSDKREENLNKTLYRDQVNKVANAIKEIITALKNPIAQSSRKTSSEQPSTKPKQNRKTLIVSLVLLSLIAISYFLYKQLTTNPDSSRDEQSTLDKSIAVLPFVNMSNDPEQEYFSDGISEEVLNLLAKVPELKVIGRTSSFYFKGKNEDLRIIGEKLGVANLLEGSVRKDGDKIRITAQLIRASDGTHLWSETYDRKLESVFELQDEIANNVLKELKLKLLGKAVTSQVNGLELQNLILKGKYFTGRAEYEKAIDFYQEALALDSGNASIWTSLAQNKIAFANSSYTKDFDENYRLAKQYANQAIAIDQDNSNAHRIFGVIKMYYDFDPKGVEEELRLALKLDRNNSDAWRNLGQFNLYFLKDYPHSEAYHKKSMEFNPLNFTTFTSFGKTYFHWGKYEKAIQVFQQGIELNPQAKVQLFYVYIVAHRPQLAKTLLQEITDVRNEREKIMMQAMVEYEMGQTEKAYQTLSSSLVDYHGDSYTPARVFAYMNKKDEAFRWLEKAYQEKFGMYEFSCDRMLANLRSDPRYRVLLKKMNIPVD